MKNMLITGTTQGIGRCIFDRYRKVFNVYTVNRRAFSGKNFICDLSNIEQVAELVETIKTLEIDILINNAGGASPIIFSEMNTRELIYCTNLNYHSPVLLMQAVLQGMKERSYGRIVNISSIASKSPRPYLPHYGAAKSALEKFSASMAVDYGESGITINCICPGGVETDTSIKKRREIAQKKEKDKEFYNKDMVENNGLGRMVKSEEVVDMIDFLISEHASAVSGQVFNICGVKEVH